MESLPCVGWAQDVIGNRSHQQGRDGKQDCPHTTAAQAASACSINAHNLAASVNFSMLSNWSASTSLRRCVEIASSASTATWASVSALEFHRPQAAVIENVPEFTD